MDSWKILSQSILQCDDFSRTIDRLLKRIYHGTERFVVGIFFLFKMEEEEISSFLCIENSFEIRTYNYLK